MTRPPEIYGNPPSRKHTERQPGESYADALSRVAGERNAALRDVAAAKEADFARLAPLCPCQHNGASLDPEQDCPIHGDGDTFVDYVRKLEALMHAARGWTVLIPIEVRRTPPVSMRTEALELLRAVEALGYADTLAGPAGEKP